LLTNFYIITRNLKVPVEIKGCNYSY